MLQLFLRLELSWLSLLGGCGHTVDARSDSEGERLLTNNVRRLRDRARLFRTTRISLHSFTTNTHFHIILRILDPPQAGSTSSNGVCAFQAARNCWRYGIVTSTCMTQQSPGAHIFHFSTDSTCRLQRTDRRHRPRSTRLWCSSSVSTCHGCLQKQRSASLTCACFWPINVHRA